MSAKTVKKIKLDSKKSGKKTTVEAEVKKAPKKERTKRSFNPFSALWEYVKGSWHEIRQVRWPNRRATWGMTLAVIGFTMFFALVILFLDGIFQALFKNFLLK